MGKKSLVITLSLVIILAGVLYMFFNPKKASYVSPLSVNEPQKVVETIPSKTLKEYSDPAGFSFNYPDNLSIVSNEPKTERVYSDVNLSAKGLTGQLKIEISDSNFKTLADWVKANTVDTATQKEVMLGTLKATQISTSDRILLGALDQGILFTIDVPLAEKKDFWSEVYTQIIKDFSFVAPTANTGAGVSSVSDVTFEGEEVVN